MKKSESTSENMTKEEDRSQKANHPEACDLRKGTEPEEDWKQLG